MAAGQGDVLRDQIVDERELRAVLAHEMSHVANRDIAISSIAAAIGTAITWIAYAAFWFGGSDDEGGNPLVGLLAVILAPLAAGIIQMAVSRSREYAADAGGAAIAGQPDGLARALEKLDTLGKRVPMQATPETAHMFIVQPFTGRALMTLFSTHPPIQERIRRLLGR